MEYQNSPYIHKDIDYEVAQSQGLNFNNLWEREIQEALQGDSEVMGFPDPDELTQMLLEDDEIQFFDAFAAFLFGSKEDAQDWRRLLRDRARALLATPKYLEIFSNHLYHLQREQQEEERTLYQPYWL